MKLEDLKENHPKSLEIKMYCLNRKVYENLFFMGICIKMQIFKRRHKFLYFEAYFR